jgi:urocanate hydratase
MQRDIQRETMRVYKTLADLREDWSGKLVLCCGPGCAQTGAPTAVSIAGGTTLAVESDAAAMKSAMRAGYLDFVVNSLDEALRTLKNEVRKRRPLSVGLVSDVGTTLNETVERGLQPDLQLILSDHRDSNYSPLETLAQRGMTSLAITEGQRHSEYHFAAADVALLRTIDAALLATLSAEDARRRWVERIPAYLREARTGGRWIWLTTAECESLAAAGFSPRQQLSGAPTGS